MVENIDRTKSKSSLISHVRFFKRSSTYMSHGLLMDYTITAAITILFLAGAAVMQPFIGIENVTYVPLLAVLFASWYAGFRTGIASTILSTIFLIYLTFLTYHGNLPVASVVAIILYVLTGTITSIIIHTSSNAARIDEYKKKEKQYLEHLIELQKAHKKALAEVKARDEFLSIVSHELKTPLTSMLLKLQTVLHNIRNVSLANFSVENLLKMLESAEQQSKRLSKMITDLLNVSMITQGKIELEREKMDLTQTTKDVIERFKEKLEKEKYHLTVDAEKPVIGNWDKLRIEQAMTNLLGNAIKYGKGNPITIRVMNSHGTGKFIIEDNGIGIPKSLQEQIFTRFGRAVNTQEFEGLGVGLYITQQIVLAHNGDLQVKSREGEGSTFIVELPLDQA